MTPEEWLESISVFQVIVWVTAATALIAGAWKLRAIGRPAQNFLEDWNGRPARPGFPKIPSVPERLESTEIKLERIEHGIERLEANDVALKAATDANTAQIKSLTVQVNEQGEAIRRQDEAIEFLCAELHKNHPETEGGPCAGP